MVKQQNELINASIPSFLGGVSQQPDKLKFPSQLVSQKNGFPDPVKGLLKRPPSEHLAKLLTGNYSNCYIYTIEKESEQYVVVLTGTDLKVFDLEGNEKTVVFPDGKTYITNSAVADNFHMCTVGDYTFILNKTVSTAMTSTNAEHDYNNPALIWVKQGDYASDYKLYLNGALYATNTTGSTDVDIADLKTTTIAADLATQLQTNCGGNYTVNRAGSVIFLNRLAPGDYTFRSEDTNGGKNLKSFKEFTPAIEDMPSTAPDGLILRVLGNDSTAKDDYYVKFTTADGSTFGHGGWVQCAAYGIQNSIDASTMPHALIRESDGTFTFQELEWTDREAGDADTNKLPSFIGSPISDVFLYKSRLGFLSSENVILSSTKDIFSFFRETVLTILDSDPIDVTATSSSLSDLKFTIPFSKSLLISTNSSQHILKGQDILSVKTVSIDLATEYSVLDKARPVASGSNIFLGYETNNYAGIREYYLKQGITEDAEAITQQVPQYIPANIIKLACSNLCELLAVVSENDPYRIYTYKFHYEKDRKIQAAWSYFEFTGKILHVTFIKNVMYLILQYDDGIYLESIDFSSSRIDDVGFLVNLDRKLYNPSFSYDSAINKTTFTLPYVVKSTDTIKVIKDTGISTTITDQTIGSTTTTIKILGDYTSENVIIGITYDFKITLPKFYVKKKDRTTGAYKVIEGLLMVRDLVINYADTGSFTVGVETSKGNTSTYKFTGKQLGINTALNTAPITSGKITVPILSNNEYVDVSISNDSYLPSCLLSANWDAMLTLRSTPI